MHLMQFPRVVVAHRGSRVGVSGRDLGIAQIHTGIQHRRHSGVSEHVRVHARDVHTGDGLQASQPAGAGVPVHAGAAAVEPDRPSDAVADCAVDRARDGGWHRYEHDLVALADDSQHWMAVLFTDVGDVHAGCFGDPQPKEAEQADEAPRPP
jgi:hypothetical protein